MCYKAGVILCGNFFVLENSNALAKEESQCGFSEVVGDLSVVEEITKYGTIRLESKDPTFKMMFKNVWAKFF